MAKVRLKGSGAYFLVHIEHQNTAPVTFPRRFFRYFSTIFERRNLPIYPIVVFAQNKPGKQQPDFYSVAFPDIEVLRFNYRVVQLNRLSWKTFLKSENPVAIALMGKMDIEEKDRPRVKALCLRRLLSLKLDDARTDLIGSFVDNYLNLNEAEQERFYAEIPPKEKEKFMYIETRWHAQGRQEGMQEGRQEGQIEASRRFALEMLESRFGKLPKRVIRGTEGIDLIALSKRSQSAASLRELGL